MKGIDYKYANGKLLGNDPNVYDLPVCNFEHSDGIKAVESCWQTSLKERLCILLTGKVYFQCWGRTHPPILLSTRAALDEGVKLRDKHGWPIEKIKGRPVTNAIRIILHMNLKQTFRRRKL